MIYLISPSNSPGAKNGSKKVGGIIYSEIHFIRSHKNKEGLSIPNLILSVDWQMRGELFDDIIPNIEMIEPISEDDD